MTTLHKFYLDCYLWHKGAPGRRFCNEARVKVFRRQLARFSGDTVMRHIAQTRRALDRAEAAARLDASRERNREQKAA